MASGNHTDLDKFPKSTNKEPIVGLSFQFKITRAIEEKEIPPTLPNRIYI